MTSLQKNLRNWKGTFEINFDFAVHSKIDLTKQVYQKSYYEIQDIEESDFITIACISLIRFDDFNIEYCSNGQNVGNLKFTTNFYGLDESGSQRKSIEIPLNEFNVFYSTEVKQDLNGNVDIKINDVQHSLVDTRLHRDVIVKIENNVNPTATLKDVTIKE